MRGIRENMSPNLICQTNIHVTETAFQVLAQLQYLHAFCARVVAHACYLRVARMMTVRLSEYRTPEGRGQNQNSQTQKWLTFLALSTILAATFEGYALFATEPMQKWLP